MKKFSRHAAGGLAWALAAFLYLSGCAPKVMEVKDPSLVAGRTDLSVGPEERQAFAADLRAGASGPQAARALYFLGLAEFQDGHFPEAGKYFQRVADDYANSGWDRPAVFMMAAALERMDDAPRAMVQYQRLIEPRPLTPTAAAAPEGELSQKARKEAERLVEGPLTQPQVEALISYPVFPEFQGPLYLKRVQALVASAAAAGLSGSTQVDLAFQAIDDFYRRFPDNPLRKDVESLAREADKAVPVDKKALGLILPLGGSQAAIGLQLRQGADLALDEANAGLAPADQFRLLVADEGADTTASEAAARSLITQSQVIGVIGPMSSDASQAVLPLAEARRTPMLSPFAMRPDLGTASPYFFRNCLTLEKQAKAMADHALLDLKVTRVAELYPDTPYGQTLARVFAARALELGATVVASVSYTAGNSDFKDEVVRLGGADPTILKDAGDAEKRDQQSKVEAASTVLGKALLEIKADLESRSLTAEAQGDTQSGYRPLTFPARVAVFDFASSTSAAVYNAGRSFSDRFARVLGQLDELVVLSPDDGLRHLRERALLPETLTAPVAADIGKAMNADFVLMGSVNELSPDWNYLRQASQADGKEGRQARADIELFSHNQVFQVAAQVIDARTASVVAQAQFESDKLRPPASNTLGLQAIYIPGQAGEAVQAASALSFCDLKLQLLGGDLWKKPELVQNDNASALEDARLTVGFFADSSDPGVRRFVDAYKKRYAAIPGLLAAQAYDAVLIMVGSLKGGASTREELRQALRDLHNFEGVSGRTSFDGGQDAIKRVPILRVNSVAKTFEQVQ
jgi:ABC-type branched-subunit amino acid transport system substrate-binding protein